jgi:predicted nucleic acid-binding protein
MIFQNVPPGASLFIDANVLVYRFSLHAQFATPCRLLLERIERQEVSGMTSAHVLSEAAYRLLTLEAIVKFGWPPVGINRRLRRQPADIRKLSRYRRAIDRVLQSQLRVVDISGKLVADATAICQQQGLLSNDALILAVMQQQGLVDIASSDGDFDRVPWITRYAPA